MSYMNDVDELMNGLLHEVPDQLVQEVETPKAAISPPTIAPRAVDEVRASPGDDDDELDAEPYHFPVQALNGSWPDLEAMTVAGLVDELHEVSFQVDGEELVPYESVRERICSIGIELNRRGKLAPRFRPMRVPPYRPMTSGDKLLGLDRQFLDLHWLRCVGWNRCIRSDRWQFDNLFKTKEFKVAVAEKFASVKMTANDKAEWLSLSDTMAFQLAAIQTDHVRKRFNVATKGDKREDGLRERGCRQIVAQLETSVSNQPHLQDQVEQWANIWLAAKLVGEQGELLRQFHALLTGADKPLDRRDIIRRLDAIKKRLGEVRAAERLAA